MVHTLASLIVGCGSRSCKPLGVAGVWYMLLTWAVVHALESPSHGYNELSKQWLLGVLSAEQVITMFH